MKNITIFFCFAILHYGCVFNKNNPKNNTDLAVYSKIQIKGLSFVAPPQPFEQDPIPAIKAIHADWVAVILYAFACIGEPKVHYS